MSFYGGKAPARLFEQICNLYSQSMIDTYRDIIRKAVLASSFFLFEIIGIYSLGHWIYDPVFSYSGSAVLEQFDPIIQLLGGG